MPIPLGILAVAGAGGGAGGPAYELISTTVLGSDTASVTFDVSTFASTYKHLQIRLVAKCGRGDQDYLGLRMNGVTTTSSYISHLLEGSGTVYSSSLSGYGHMFLPFATGASTASTVFGASVVDILDPFSTTKNKTVRSLGGTSATVTLFSGLFMSTSSVTSLTVFQYNSTNLKVGSRFSLYGIKG